MAFLRHGPEAVALLEQNSQLRFRARELHPEDKSNLPDATLKGRVLEAELEADPFDGRVLKFLLGLIRGPIPEFTILSGMRPSQSITPVAASSTRRCPIICSAGGFSTRTPIHLTCRRF
jgi:hypothetical protein